MNPRNGFRAKMLATVLVALLAPQAAALTLTEAVELARRNDPAYLSAQAGLKAAQERESQARSAMLPQLAATVNTSTNRRDYTVRDALSTESLTTYNSHSGQLNLTQPLWRHANLISLDQSRAAAAQAGHQLDAAGLDMLVRLSQAWFDFMLAGDSLLYAEQGVALARHQLAQLQYSSEVGLGSETALAEARAKHEQAVAEAAAAQSDLDVKISALEQIVGIIPGAPPPALPERFPLPAPGRDTLESWLNAADSGNPSILAAQFALGSAREEIRKQRAGHEPTLDIVGSYGRNAQGTGTFPGQSGYDITQQTLGLQLNIPLYSGGGQQAKVREAVALVERAAQDLETARRNARAAVKQAWFGWQASRARHDAALHLANFFSLSLESAMLGKEKGVRSELDILQARQQLSGARRDLQKARYGMLINSLRLKAAAGQPIEHDLAALSAALEPNGP